MKLPKLTKAVLRQLEAIADDRVVVAAVKTIVIDALANYSQLGLTVSNGRFAANMPAPPPRSCGKWAVRNLDGWNEKRKDLPKEDREISTYAPSWNGGGYHPVSRTMRAWPVTHHSAKNLALSASILEHLKDAAIVRFRVDQPLDRHTANFAQDLNFNLRLLREAVGEAGIYPADLSDSEFARLQHVEWELLPPGAVDRVLTQIRSRRFVDPRRLEVAQSRLTTLDRLNPDAFVVGRGRFAAYFGAKFGSKIVALENLEYGNAIYVFADDWEALSQLSRTELIRRRDPSVVRIPHLPGWQSALRKRLRAT
ncbi:MULTISPECIES: hypothetical protein [Sphingomonas]|uniref:hypothetical protein n=1 Tax=Sphingomonas TaxID=13687 RepID=UPI000DF00A8C|nr:MULTISPECIES: hypothetical protein [Sphingomonas]